MRLMQVSETTPVSQAESFFPLDQQGSTEACHQEGIQNGVCEQHRNEQQYQNSKESGQESRRGSRKRRVYATEEERRMARILKNRRTAEASRLRRIQKIQELQNILMEFQQREEKLNEEIVQLRQELAAQVAEVNRLRAALLRRQK